MFSKIQALIRKRKIRKAFAAYVDPAMVEELVKGEFKPSSLRQETFAFVIVEVPISSDLPEQVSALTELALAHCAMIHDIVCNVMVATFGIFPDTANTASRCVPFVEAVVSRFGGGVRVVYAYGQGEVGNLGGPNRLSFTFVHPKFPAALALLPTVAWGEAKDAADV